MIAENNSDFHCCCKKNHSSTLSVSVYGVLQQNLLIKFNFLPPSSGQCGYGGAGEGAEETSGGEVPEGPLRGNSCPLWCQGTTETVSFFPYCSFCYPYSSFSFLLFVIPFILSFLGHTTAEQTKPDL